MDNSIRVLIVDDENLSIETLRSLLEKFHADKIDVVGTARSASEARDAVAAKDPDAIFLDIDMPKENGLDFLNSLPERNFAVIFVTAYDDYALPAIKSNPVDYLLKPIDIDELNLAVVKLHSMISNNEIRSPHYQARLTAMLENLFQGKQKLTKLKVPLRNGFYVVSLDTVLFFRADGNYSKMYISNQEAILTSKSIKEYEAQLSGINFVRVHKSYLINIHYIKAYTSHENGSGYVTLSNNEKVYVSRRKKEELIKKLQEYGLE